MAACVTTVTIAFIVCFIGLGNMGLDRSLPVYTSEQYSSTHPGYRRITITRRRKHQQTQTNG
jgi:hypothetical protein